MSIVIIGLGAIGGSFAMGLKSAKYTEVYGVDTDQETVDTALKLGLIKEGSFEAADFLPKADVVLLSLYPKQIKPFVEQYKSFFKKDAVLTDVTGVKEKLIEEVVPLLPKNVDFVFAHPMRGSEKAGFIGADHKRFIGANALITPIPSNKEKNLLLVENLYKDIGFQTITRVNPKLHDEQIAYVSQLMHALSVSVVNSPQASEETLDFAGNSFQELTRIADINGDLWSELFLNNRKALLTSIEAFEKELDSLKQALMDNNEEALKEIFTNARKQRKEWF